MSIIPIKPVIKHILLNDILSAIAIIATYVGIVLEAYLLLPGIFSSQEAIIKLFVILILAMVLTEVAKEWMLEIIQLSKEK